MSASRAGVSIELYPRGEDGPATRVEAVDAHHLPARVETADGAPHGLHLSHLTDGGGLRGCIACGHPELYKQKDFPRAVGIVVVVIAAVLAPFTWYLSLVGAAAFDWILYHVAPDVVCCYVCRARHRGFPEPPRHPRFDREIEERLLYGDKAVMGRPMRRGGTADASEPEH